MGSQLPPKRGTAPQFSAHVYCGHGRPSNILLSSCRTFLESNDSYLDKPYNIAYRGMFVRWTQCHEQQMTGREYGCPKWHPCSREVPPRRGSRPVDTCCFLLLLPTRPVHTCDRYTFPVLTGRDDGPCLITGRVERSPWTRLAVCAPTEHIWTSESTIWSTKVTRNSLNKFVPIGLHFNLGNNCSLNDNNHRVICCSCDSRHLIVFIDWVELQLLID